MNGTRKDAMSGMGRFFEAVGAWSYDHRWVVIVASFAVWGLAGFLAAGARIDNSVAAFFDTDDPTYGAYLEYREDFESDEGGVAADAWPQVRPFRPQNSPLRV